MMNISSYCCRSMAMGWRQALDWMRRWRKCLLWQRRIVLMWHGLQHLLTPTPASAASMKKTTAVSKICIFILPVAFKTFCMMKCSTYVITTSNTWFEHRYVIKIKPWKIVMWTGNLYYNWQKLWGESMSVLRFFTHLFIFWQKSSNQSTQQLVKWKTW